MNLAKDIAYGFGLFVLTIFWAVCVGIGFGIPLAIIANPGVGL